MIDILKEKITRQQYYKTCPWARVLNNIMTRCGCKSNKYYKRNIKNFLTTKDLKFLWFRDKAYLMKYPSIDRINSNKDYTLDNCRFIEYEENRKQGYFKKGNIPWNKKRYVGG